jgi:hypothetical protein
VNTANLPGLKEENREVQKEEEEEEENSEDEDEAQQQLLDVFKLRIGDNK